MAKYGVLQYGAKYIIKERQRYGNGVAQVENALAILSDSERGEGEDAAPGKIRRCYIGNVYFGIRWREISDGSLSLSSEFPDRPFRMGVFRDLPIGEVGAD